MLAYQNNTAIGKDKNNVTSIVEMQTHAKKHSFFQAIVFNLFHISTKGVLSIIIYLQKERTNMTYKIRGLTSNQIKRV